MKTVKIICDFCNSETTEKESTLWFDNDICPKCHKKYGFDYYPNNVEIKTENGKTTFTIKEDFKPSENTILINPFYFLRFELIQKKLRQDLNKIIKNRNVNNRRF